YGSTRERSPTGRRSSTSTDGGLSRRGSPGWQRRLLQEALECLELDTLRGTDELQQGLLAGRRQHPGGAHLLPRRRDVTRPSRRRRVARDLDLVTERQEIVHRLIDAGVCLDACDEDLSPGARRAPLREGRRAPAAHAHLREH